MRELSDETPRRLARVAASRIDERGIHKIHGSGEG
jgi:hypothetical protein